MDLDFQKHDFDKLMFPIMGMKENASPVKEFPKLSKYPEFTDFCGSKMSTVRRCRIFKYIVLMYDKNSPFISKVPDNNRRKIEVAKFVNLIPDPKVVEESIKNILKNSDEKVNKMIIAFCRMQNDPLWSLVVALDQKYYNELLSIFDNTSDSRLKISETLKELQEAQNELLARDNNPELIKELFDNIEEERVSDLRPEGIAEIFANGDKPFKDYEPDYNQEDD